jgi:hypothetical protein
MALIELRVNPTAKDLRWFGAILLAFFGLVGLVVWRATGTLGWPNAIWGAAALVSGAYYLVRPLRRPLYIGWSYATYPIGWVVSHVLMAVVFFGLLTVCGVLMRLFGYDPLTRRFDRSASTYWVEHEEATDVSNYFRQH